MTGPLSVLIICTETPDLHLLGEAFRQYGIPYRHLPSEEDATLQTYLQKGLADAMFVPTLIMLDEDSCNPATILTLLKQHPVLRRIPVIVYGQGSNPQSVKLAYQWGATCYMPRPQQWDAVMVSFCAYWKKHVALPAVKAEDILSSNSFFNQDQRHFL